MANSKSAEILATLIKTIEDLSTRVTILETPKMVIEPIQEIKSAPEPVKDGYSEPISTEFREAVDTILNKEFEIQLDSRETPGAFGFSVLVPKKYSNAPQSHWDTFKEDRRFKPVPRPEGVLGVRDYLYKVFNNLTQDARTQIVIDRSKNA